MIKEKILSGNETNENSTEKIQLNKKKSLIENYSSKKTIK